MQSEYHYFTKPQQVKDWCQFILDNWDFTKGIAVKSELDGGKEARTLAQNAAIHIWCRQMADALNENGLDQQVVVEQIKPEGRMWTAERFKESILKGIIFALFQETSTTKLTKKQLSDAHDVTASFFRSKFPEYNLPLDMPHKETLK